jgi:uncharacterized membrane protein YczE
MQHLIKPEEWFSRNVCFGAGLIVIVIGTAIYLHTNFTPMPIDLLMLIIRDLTKLNIMLSKTLIYFIFLIMAFIFNGPIGVGTLLTALMGGPLPNYFMAFTEITMKKVFKKKLHYFN